MADMKNEFAAKLYRANCPPSLELGEYSLGIVPADRRQWIKAHLDECPHCSNELKMLNTYLDTLAPELEPSFAQRVQTWIARLIPDLSTSAGSQFGFATRGDDSSVLTYAAGDAQLNLEIQTDPAQPDRRTLLGLLVGSDTQGMNVLLLQAGHSLAASSLDDLGNFVLTGIQPGEYALALRGPDLEIVIESLPVA